MHDWTSGFTTTRQTTNPGYLLRSRVDLFLDENHKQNRITQCIGLDHYERSLTGIVNWA